uniref:Zinc finger protein n=1 Tax=Rhipicephalus zambeziensis TaxID=60191 RepID=A0A224Z4C5_9ACAR
MPQAEFQKQVLRQLQVMRILIEQVHDRLDRSQAPTQQCPEAVTPALITKAFSSLEEFLEFDNNTPAIREQLLHEFQSLGGDNVSAATKRILVYIMDDTVAQHYSWIGNKGKRKFRDLNTMPVIMDAVKSNRSFDATANDDEVVVKKWLQHASCRLKLKQDRFAKRAEATSEHHDQDVD